MENIIAFFACNGTPKLGLSPTIRVHKILVGSPNSDLVVEDDPMVEFGDGFYLYIFAGFDPREEYAFRADGGSTSPPEDRFVIGATESPTPEENSDAVWVATAADFAGAGSMGLLQNETATDVVSILAIVEEIIKYDRNRTVLDKIEKTLTIFGDDGVTPIRVFKLRDSTGAQSITEIVERDPQTGSPNVGIPI